MIDIINYLHQMKQEKVLSKRIVKDLVRGELVASFPEVIDEYTNYFKALRTHPRSYLKDDVEKPIKEYLPAYTELCKMDAYTAVLDLFVCIALSPSVSEIRNIVGRYEVTLGIDDICTSAETAAYIIDGLAVGNVYDIYKKGKKSMLSHNIELSQEVRHSIENTMYLPPMLTQPQEIISNNSSGALTEDTSVLLGMLHHKQTLNLDVLNTLNSIELCLDEYMLQFEEVSKKQLNTKAALEFEAMSRISAKVYENIITTGNKFYFTWKYDSRGRTYSQGYHCNLQSFEYKKSLISLYNKELITDEILV